MEGFEHVAVAHVGGDHPDAALGHQPVEAEVRHRGDDDELDLEVKRQDREDLVAVHLVPGGVDREHPVTVSVECHPEVDRAAAHGRGEEREVGRPAALVDVRAVRAGGNRRDGRTETLDCRRRDVGQSPVRAVHRDPQPLERSSEAVAGEVHVPIGEAAERRHLRARGCRRRVEPCLDLFLLFVGQLRAAGEELDTVVLGGIVRGRHDGAVRLGEQRDRGGRQHARQRHRRPAGGETLGERALDVGARAAGVPADEDRRAVAPEREGPAQALDQWEGQIGADDAADTVRSEVPAQGRVATASRTAVACAPSSGRPSCARPVWRRGSGSPDA